MTRIRIPLRLWQTTLFVFVIVVASLIVAGSLSAGLKTSLVLQGRSGGLRDAAALASRLGPEFSENAEGLATTRASVSEYHLIYGDGVWVYDRQGHQLAAAYDTRPATETVTSARDAALAGQPSAAMDLRSGGWTVASALIRGADAAPIGAVVLAGPVASSLAVLDAARMRLWVTFWIALTVAGLIGYVFSEFIARQVRAMTRAASSIAGGDFSQRVPAGLVPAEMIDLAESYNLMAAKLGDAFAALQESEREIAAVVESMAEGVVALDAEGIARIVNPEAARLLGIDSGALVGADARALVRDPVVQEVLTQGLGGAAVSATTTLGERAVLLHCTPTITGPSERGGVVLVMADVTEQRRLEETQRRFVADASHELRTPIAAIGGMLELLRDGAKDDPEVCDDFMLTMQLEVERLGRLVADLLTLAQLESSGFQPRLEPTTLSEMIANVGSVMSGLADRAGITLDTDAGDPDVTVLADRDRIVQVLVGLVDNAISYSPQGTRVRLRSRCGEGVATIEVADEGPGMTTEQLDRVFERFYRADESRGRTRGTGLGLAIAKEIVEAHGSAINVASAPGSGATFAFDLQIVR